MTIHNEATKEDIAKNVIMPGDPLRAQMIAEKYLSDYKQVNSVRGMYAYTGYYKDTKITVMASGMGIPSMGIYSYELFKFYNVDNIIRIGSCGSMTSDLDLYDLFVVTAAESISTYATSFGDNGKCFFASKKLNDNIINTAKKLNQKIKMGKTYSNDAFYADNNMEDLKKNDCLVQEMETFALFFNAKLLNKNAASILTVSDNLITNKRTTPLERQNSFNDMIELALETILNK